MRIAGCVRKYADIPEQGAMGGILERTTVMSHTNIVAIVHAAFALASILLRSDLFHAVGYTVLAGLHVSLPNRSPARRIGPTAATSHAETEPRVKPKDDGGVEPGAQADINSQPGSEP